MLRLRSVKCGLRAAFFFVCAAGTLFIERVTPVLSLGQRVNRSRATTLRAPCEERFDEHVEIA